MMITTLTSHELNRAVARAKLASMHGPVVITNRGKPTHVLLTVAAYQRLCGRQRNIAHALFMPTDENIEFEPARLNW